MRGTLSDVIPAPICTFNTLHIVDGWLRRALYELLIMQNNLLSWPIILHTLDSVPMIIKSVWTRKKEEKIWLDTKLKTKLSFVKCICTRWVACKDFPPLNHSFFHPIIQWSPMRESVGYGHSSIKFRERAELKQRERAGKVINSALGKKWENTSIQGQTQVHPCGGNRTNWTSVRF